MYFDTASFALSSVVCAISRIFSACSLICSLIALSITGVCDHANFSSAHQLTAADVSRGRLNDLFQLLAKLIHQHACIFAIIDRHHDEVHAAALERVFERRNQ